MGIKSNIPQIVALRKAVEVRFGKPLTVHADFLTLVAEIEMLQRQHISESTLERVWGYSTRGYNTVSLRTLDVLSRYAEGCDWQEFCEKLASEGGCESELFNTEHIHTNNLAVGDRLQIGWLPDRLCRIRYLGEGRFVAEECLNCKMQPGDRFLCHQFTLGKEAQLADFRRGGNDSSEGQTYVIGTQHGLTTLKRLI